MKRLNIELMISLLIFTLAIVAGIIFQKYNQDTIALLLCMVASFFIGIFVRTAILIEKTRHEEYSSDIIDKIVKEEELKDNCNHPRWMTDQY